MTLNDRHPGYSVREPDGKEREVLAAGRCYRVIRPFLDFDGYAHLPGEQWLFKAYSYWARDDGTTFFVSVDGGSREETIRFSPMLDDLDAYLVPATSETNPAPASTTRERVLALVKTAFADLRRIEDIAPDDTPRGATPRDVPGPFFEPEITPPLPVQWPPERFVYYAYARQILEGGAENVSEAPSDQNVSGLSLWFL